MPNCRLDLYEDETETDDPTVVGENCHIVSESDDGPRADALMPLERRNSYSNLILLCRNHHKVIDSQEIEYSVERLHKMKKSHEDWVKEQLGFDDKKQADDETYAGVIDTWERLAHVDDWFSWASDMLHAGQPSMRVEIDEDLHSLRLWLLNRIWPKRYKKIEIAFENFRRVLEDLQEEFRRHAGPSHQNTRLMTEKFYKIPEWNERRYNNLLSKFEFHVDLVEDLMLELTRAANLICDSIRNELMRSYRVKEGHLMLQYGPTAGFSYHRHVVQYRNEEIAEEIPYPGLEEFLDARKDRDLHFGKGKSP